MVTIHSIRFKFSNSEFFFTQCMNVFLVMFAVCVNSDYCLYTVNICVFVMEAQFFCVRGRH